MFRTKSAVLPARVRVLAVVQCLCLAGCLSESESLTSRCSTKTAERIELVFGMGASFDLSYTVFSRHLGTSKNKVTSLLNFVLNSGFWKFRQDKSIIEMWYQLTSTKVDHRPSTKLTIPPSSDGRLLVYRRQALCSVYSTIPLRGFISDSWYVLAFCDSFVIL